jgi:hypothetical protein
MNTHVCDWRIELINAHRNLFRPPAKAPVLAMGYPDCGPGWRSLLNSACARIDAALDAEERVAIQQIKEKHGTLRFYWQGTLSTKSRAKVEEAIALAEARSACTCEECGEEGRLYRACGALMTRCKAHAKGQPVSIKRGFENVHIIQRLVSTESQVVYRRYDRATDSFCSVDPGALGIEEE